MRWGARPSTASGESARRATSPTCPTRAATRPPPCWPPRSTEGPASGWLAPEEVAELLDCYGLPLAEWRLADSPEEAGAAAASSAARSR